MYVILLKYLKPIEVVDQYIVEHRAYLEEGYKKDCFIASGPQNPRTGGVILSQLQDRAQLESLIEQDPFYIHKIAAFTVIEFSAVKFHPDFAKFVTG